MKQELDVLVEAGALLGECPVWDDRTRTLLWVDIRRHEVHRTDIETGHDRFVTLTEPVGSIALRDGRGLIAAVGMGIGELDDQAGTFTRWASVSRGDRLNDGACDPAGRFWVGTLTASETPGGAALYVLDARTMRAEQMLANVTLSNGLAWSPEGRTAYFVDTYTERIEAFDFDPDIARLSGRRIIVDLHDVPGRPDGLAVDSEGNLWVAMAKGRAIRCYDTGGVLRHVIPVPAPLVTNCAFGGPDLDQLFITTGQLPATPASAGVRSAGAVFRLRDLGVRGLPAARFSESASTSPSTEEVVPRPDNGAHAQLVDGRGE